MSTWEAGPLPGREALWLAGEMPGNKGPLGNRGLPGKIDRTEDGDGVTLDERALFSLAHLGFLGVDTGAVIYDGDIPLLVFGKARYVIRET